MRSAQTHKTASRALASLALTAALGAQEALPTGEQTLPRFRAGASLVRVDAYITEGGVPAADLSAEDVELLEDGALQRIETFERIAPRPPGEMSARIEPNSAAEAATMAADPKARVFVLFMDVWHVQADGAYRAKTPVLQLLDRAIGQSDLVGVMTPEMSAQNLTLARRQATIEGILRDNPFWGERDRVGWTDPREPAIRLCYPDEGDTQGIAAAMIARRREAKTLAAIEDLVEHLETVREERKFVVLLSEGWALHKQDQSLARPLRAASGADPRVPGRPEPARVGPGGWTLGPEPGLMAYESCERERAMLAFADRELTFRRLLQRANRANVSFYPVDARGGVVFDEPIGPARPPSAPDDARGLAARQDALRELAAQTDGFAVLNTEAFEPAIARIVADTGTYYLLGYYSTNTKPDGKFRQVSVRAKRAGLEVRARPGYLAPTEAELASARVDALMNGAAPGHSNAATISRVLSALGTSRGTVPLRAQAAGGPGYVWFTAELDAATIKRPEWLQGGRALVSIEHERGEVAPVVVDVELEPGQRTLSLVRPQGGRLAPGRYVVRAQLTPVGQRGQLQTTVDAHVKGEGALLSLTALSSRRGPSTGLEYQRTADPRFRRTERLRLEIPRFAAGSVVTARLENRSGQVLPLSVSVTERDDEQLQAQIVVAELALAPLAQGEYVLEVEATAEGKKEQASFGFRIVP